MKLTLNVKPTTYEAPTKDQLVSKVTRGKINTNGITSKNGKTFSYNGYKTDESKITVMNVLKVRKKVIQTKDKKTKKTKSKVLSKSHWVAYVYTFDINVLKELGYKRIEQKTRNFVLSK